MPEARQNSSKLAEMLAIASSFNALGGTAVDVVGLFMALLSFVGSAPRAYRLKASNAAPPISTSIGTIPTTCHHVILLMANTFCLPRPSWIANLRLITQEHPVQFASCRGGPSLGRVMTTTDKYRHYAQAR